MQLSSVRSLARETGTAISDCLHARALPGCRLPYTHSRRPTSALLRHPSTPFLSSPLAASAAAAAREAKPLSFYLVADFAVRLTVLRVDRLRLRFNRAIVYENNFVIW